MRKTLQGAKLNFKTVNEVAGYKCVPEEKKMLNKNMWVVGAVARSEVYSLFI